MSGSFNTMFNVVAAASIALLANARRSSEMLCIDVRVTPRNDRQFN